MMRFFSKSHDGGKDSGVTGYFLVEIKPLFSIVLLKFNKGTRDAYHNHAFNAFTIWLSGEVFEHFLNAGTKTWGSGNFKYTRKSDFHKIQALRDSWALSFRGPWDKTWKEFKNNKFITLSNGRVVVEDNE